MKRKIGIFGGTFNPPHIGHVSAAAEFIKAMDLDELLIIPDYLPPHKEYSGRVTPEQRIQMCRLAFESIEGAVVSDMEISRGGKSYTADTLQLLSSHEADLYFLCGTDMFLTLDKWRTPEIIFSLAQICCIRRENDYSVRRDIDACTEKYKAKYNAKLHFIDSDVVEISSSELRDELKRGKNSEYIPESVMGYINDMGLYL